MSFILRKIRKAKWYKNSNVGWLKEGELQADALVDLKTDSNRLSVYYVEADESNLERIITALAATSDSPSNLDYALIDTLILDQLGIQTLAIPGVTPDEKVNKWHIDLTELTAAALYNLAQQIHTNAKMNIRRKAEKDIKELLKDGILKDQLDKTKMKREMLDHLRL